MQTVDGNVVTGIIQSQTDDAVVLKLKDDITRTFPRSQIEQMKKSDVSLMPADLQKIITTQELVDIVDYMLTLKAGNEK